MTYKVRLIGVFFLMIFIPIENFEEAGDNSEILTYSIQRVP